ncbi:hypothetical protein DI063_11385 [Legionella pneumophila]|nr:hypothetical protein AXF35_11685 [Legionella pneumophila subsp. pascullei]ANH12413.1 hypothetical protein A5478_05025 [Legionella pneumophila]AMP92020.1 hypothetical protein AXF36_05115 [Legionella pneumophila subsp. pascullei]AMP94985.1 hypothetical protein AXF37_05005 [Legionella pneumophila subsp. pascullei]ANH15380.1 hypothetical protein A5480_05020 [Legionella pneumophila]
MPYEPTLIINQFFIHNLLHFLIIFVNMRSHDLATECNMKTTKYSSNLINQLPNNKPVVYEIQTAGGNKNYIGTAKRGRVTGRIAEHIGTIPGAQVKIKQFSSIQEARKSEAKQISKFQPKYNKQGK